MAKAFPFTLNPECGDGRVRKTNINPAFKVVEPNDSKYLEWTFKLGAGLRDNLLGPKYRQFQDKLCYLKAFPKNYHLYVDQVSKNGKNRNDYYLHGHPSGKAYRSPNEFLPHLLWIVGGVNDPGLCICRICLDKSQPLPLPDWWPKTSGQVEGSVNTPGPVSASPAASSTLVTSMKRNPSTTSVAPASTATKPPQSAPVLAAAKPPLPVPAPAATRPPMPTPVSAATRPPMPIPAPAAAKPPLPVPAPAAAKPPPQMPAVAATQQKIQPLPAFGHPSQQKTPTPSTAQAPPPVETTLFRGGEVVWFRNNNAWRIGITVKTAAEAGPAMPQARYLLKPLAHSAVMLETVIKLEAEMRPFLAFSVPPVNLKDISSQRIQHIPWQHVQVQYGGGDRQKLELIALEASKMAVLEIDHSYSTFNALPEAQPNSNFQRVGGVFLGAERMCVGEAVRVLLSPEETNPAWPKGIPIVLVLHEIVVAKQQDGTEKLFFRGDIYCLEEVGGPPPPTQPQPQPQLPAALLRERQFRNRVKQALNVHFEWTLLQPNVTRPEKDVRGRFYETARLMPIIDAQKFRLMLEKRVIYDIQAYLNNRLESHGPYIGRRKNRLDTFRGAVPADFTLPLNDIVESA